MTIQNHQQAFFQALTLAITAKTEEQYQECLDMANLFSTHITEDQAKECRDKIESILEGTK